MKWTLKGKSYDPVLVRLIDAVNKDNETEIIAPENATHFATDLEFYTHFKLYTLVDLSYTPFLLYKLLDDGTNTILLDGTFTPFAKANQLSPPKIKKQNLFAYAKMVLGSMYSEGQRIRLVSTIDDVDFDSEPTPEQYQKLSRTIHSPKVKGEDQSFSLKTSMLLGDSSYEAHIKVLYNGNVELLSAKKILEQMPIRELTIE